MADKNNTGAAGAPSGDGFFAYCCTLWVNIIFFGGLFGVITYTAFFQGEVAIHEEDVAEHHESTE